MCRLLILFLCLKTICKDKGRWRLHPLVLLRGSIQPSALGSHHTSSIAVLCLSRYSGGQKGRCFYLLWPWHHSAAAPLGAGAAGCGVSWKAVLERQTRREHASEKGMHLLSWQLPSGSALSQNCLVQYLRGPASCLVFGSTNPKQLSCSGTKWITKVVKGKYCLKIKHSQSEELGLRS